MKYNKELFDGINLYRSEILDYLKQTNNHYDSIEINLND